MVSATENILPSGARQQQFVWSVSALVKRKLIQICTALLYNGNLSGFTDGNIWKGSSKNICLPGLNCYSCPGALGACPLGSLQSSLSGVFLRIPFYVLGFILLFALIFARLICGWGCPFGLVQELLYKIPTPKLQRNRFTYLLSYLKYFIALIFLIILPLAFYHFTGSGVPEEKVEAFQDQCRRQYGQDAALNPRNIIEAGKFQIATPEVKITVPPEYSYMVEARIIDGRRFILIPADDGVEVNGIAVTIPNPQE
jgi:hypothetical protein